ncbi:hypothetical protein K435DRAFT_894086 [Dendrothele bispora CBS 962.96]|uniref:Uncharacterized protein n=1 Tax=Dendrothele bispora (strain CBS 962.96) TaxID=1314807 RepID=A0A4S8M1W6_DENBC|nr:hypothetical protein K435DRAFT_894086 [Dendrothele bispora CBS 962.96]
MSLDRTASGSNANNPDTTSLASVESPLAASSVHGPSTSMHASPTSVSVGPSASAPASPSISAPAGLSVTATTSPSVSGGNPSVSAPANPSISTPVAGPSISTPFTGASIYIPVAGASVSTPVGPFVSAPASPSAHEDNHHSNTPPPDNIENVAYQGQVDNTEDITQTAGRQQPRSRRHPLLGQRQAPFAGAAETYDYTQIFEEDEPYTEMGPSARVWKVYNQEIIRIDSDRIEDWRDGLDSLLVFVCCSLLCCYYNFCCSDIHKSSARLGRGDCKSLGRADCCPTCWIQRKFNRFHSPISAQPFLYIHSSPFGCGHQCTLVLQSCS